jgi:hypothetical protein
MKCRDATQLLSQQLDRKLTLPVRLGLDFHLVVCSGCRTFRRNLSLLRTACQHLSADHPTKT